MFPFAFYNQIEDVSDIKVIRTDTAHDLSQKAEKRLFLIIGKII